MHIRTDETGRIFWGQTGIDGSYLCTHGDKMVIDRHEDNSICGVILMREGEHKAMWFPR